MSVWYPHITSRLERSNVENMYKFIEISERENIGIIKLNRPKILNAWHKPMRDEFVNALRLFDKNEDIGAIILTGAGDRAFCAGQDLGEAENFDADRAEAWIEEWRVLFGTIRDLTKPLLVALNGLAAGSGFQVALYADIRIGHSGVKLGQPEVNSGIASITGPWIMHEMLGLSRTVELALTGRMMDANECFQIGLIHRIVPKNDVMNETFRIAKSLASKSRIAIRLTKQGLKEATEAGFLHVLETAARIHRECYGSGDPQKVMHRFLRERSEKRKA